MPKPFRFGVQSGRCRSASEWRTLARTVEDLGYSTLSVPDHFASVELSAPVAMAIAAAATTRLRVGSLVFDNDFRHPALLAKEMATLDRLSDGRVEVGLGAGWLKPEYTAIGLPYDRAGVRIDRLAEALEVIKGAWRGEPFSFAGEHYTITDYTGLPAPVQQPPPVLIGGGGQRVLSLAGREADIVGINPKVSFGPDSRTNTLDAATRQKVAWIRDAAGTRYDDLELQVCPFAAVVTNDRRAAAERLAPRLALEPDQVLESSTALLGSVDEIVETMIRRREEWGVSYLVVTDLVAKAMAPVVARLAGT